MEAIIIGVIALMLLIEANMFAYCMRKTARFNREND